MTIVLLAILIGCILRFFIVAGLVWVVCWGLAALGIATITWSWTLSFVVWIISILFIKVKISFD